MVYEAVNPTTREKSGVTTGEDVISTEVVRSAESSSPTQSSTQYSPSMSPPCASSSHDQSPHNMSYSGYFSPCLSAELPLPFISGKFTSSIESTETVTPRPAHLTQLQYEYTRLQARVCEQLASFGETLRRFIVVEDVQSNTTLRACSEGDASDTDADSVSDASVASVESLAVDSTDDVAGIIAQEMRWCEDNQLGLSSCQCTSEENKAEPG
eukprot:scpid99533/ scgid8540/ 